jgi:hypothetical protein
MEKRTNKRTLKELFEFTSDDIVEPYEVVRTVGFTLKCKSRDREFRLEAIKRPGEKLSSVLVWEKGKDGAWEHGSIDAEPTLYRIHPDLALHSMVLYMTQHFPQY